MKILDLTNQRFGKLTAIKRVPYKKKGVYWLCKCDCGNETIVQSTMLRSKHTRSCGCLLDGSFNVTHGMVHTRIYRLWANIVQRCCNPKATAYHKYGAKGITICDEWRNDFSSFYSWAISHGYDDSLSIDRIDCTKGYAPDNCRFITMREQQNNRSSNLYITIDGKTDTLANWCRTLNISYSQAQHRIHRNGIAPDKALLSLCNA